MHIGAEYEADGPPIVPCMALTHLPRCAQLFVCFSPADCTTCIQRTGLTAKPDSYE